MFESAALSHDLSKEEFDKIGSTHSSNWWRRARRAC